MAAENSVDKMYSILRPVIILFCIFPPLVISLADLNQPRFQWPLCHMTNAFDTVNRVDGTNPTFAQCAPLAEGPPLMTPPFHAFWFEAGAGTYAEMPTEPTSSNSPYGSFSVSLYVYPEILDGVILHYEASNTEADRITSFLMSVQSSRLKVALLDPDGNLVALAKSSNTLLLHQWNLLMFTRDFATGLLLVRVNNEFHTITTAASITQDGSSNDEENDESYTSGSGGDSDVNSDGDGDGDSSCTDCNDDSEDGDSGVNESEIIPKKRNCDNRIWDAAPNNQDGSSNDEETDGSGTDEGDGDADGDGDDGSCSDCGGGDNDDGDSGVDATKFLLLTEGTIRVAHAPTAGHTSFNGRVCCLAMYDDVIDHLAPVEVVLNSFIDTEDLVGDLTGVATGCPVDGLTTTAPATDTTSLTGVDTITPTAHTAISTAADTTLTTFTVSSTNADMWTTTTGTSLSTLPSDTTIMTSDETTSNQLIETTTGVTYDIPIKELWPLCSDSEAYGVLTNTAPRYPDYFECLRPKNPCAYTGLESLYFDGSRLSQVDLEVPDTLPEGDISISLFLLTEEPGEGTVLEFASSSSKYTGIKGYQLYFDAGELSLRISHKTGVECAHIVSQDLTKNEWSHIVIYRKVSTMTTSVFVNGVPTSITDTCQPYLSGSFPPSAPATMGTLRIGRSNDQSHGVIGFHGSISCLTVFDDIVDRLIVEDATIERCRTLNAAFSLPASCNKQHFPVTSRRFTLLARDKRPGHAGVPGPVAAKNVTSLLDCSQRCSAFPFCRSFSFNQAGGQSRSLCRLYDFVTNYLLTDDQGYNYYEIIPDI